MLAKNSVLWAAELGILAASEKKIIKLFQRPKVGVMSTGHEVSFCFLKSLHLLKQYVVKIPYLANEDFYVSAVIVRVPHIIWHVWQDGGKRHLVQR